MDELLTAIHLSINNVHEKTPQQVDKHFENILCSELLNKVMLQLMPTPQEYWEKCEYICDSMWT